MFLADPAKETVEGAFAFCFKTTPKQIGASDLGREVFWGCTPQNKEGSSVIDSVAKMMEQLLIPGLRNNDNWGDMVSTDASKERLFLSMENVVTSLHQAKGAVENTIRLKSMTEEEADGFSFANCATPAAMKKASDNPKTVEKVTMLVARWCDQISRCLTINEQIRSEPDDAGPMVELSHWKARTAVFNALADQIKNPDCEIAVTLLRLSKNTKLVARWNALDSALTDKSNEAKDNVMYLQKLESTCTSLYQTDLDKIEDSLSAIMHVIGNIHSVSQYYNTNERMTALFIKVTNQLIKACRDYVYEKEPRIWEQSKDDACARLAKVKHLQKEYLRFFEIEKKRLEKTPERSQFNFPAMGVFGKSDSFISRVKIVERMLSSMHDWGKLSNSQIDGLDVISTMAKGTIKMIKQKPYDPLDIRQLDFDSDQANFFTSMVENQTRLQEFCNDLFHTNDVNRRMQLLGDFKRIKFLGIELGPHYKNTLHGAIATELDNVRKVYLAQRQDPPVPRNMPPLAGRVAWSRNLSLRLSQPVEELQSLCPQLFKEPDNQKFVKQYNKVGKVLVQYEQICWEAFSKAADSSMQGLSSSLIVKDAEGEMVLNIDPQVCSCVRVRDLVYTHRVCPQRTKIY